MLPMTIWFVDEIGHVLHQVMRVGIAAPYNLLIFVIRLCSSHLAEGLYELNVSTCDMCVGYPNKPSGIADYPI